MRWEVQDRTAVMCSVRARLYVLPVVHLCCTCSLGTTTSSHPSSLRMQFFVSKFLHGMVAFTRRMRARMKVIGRSTHRSFSIWRRGQSMETMGQFPKGLGASRWGRQNGLEATTGSKRRMRDCRRTAIRASTCQPTLCVCDLHIEFEVSQHDFALSELHIELVEVELVLQE